MAKKSKEDKDEKDLRKPVARDGAYVMMLFITLVAIGAGCVFMYLDYDEYAKSNPPKEPVPAIQKLGDKAPADPVTAAPPAPAPGPDPAPPGGMGMGGMGMPMGGMGGMMPVVP